MQGHVKFGVVDRSLQIGDAGTHGEEYGPVVAIQVLQTRCDQLRLRRVGIIVECEVDQVSQHQ
jgi:hypothetical protein